MTNNTTKKIQVLTKSQQRLFVEAVQEDRLKNLFYLLLETGLRAGEVVALRWCDIDFVNEKIFVACAVHRVKEGEYWPKSRLEVVENKNHRPRVVQMSVNAKQILRDQYQAQVTPPSQNDFLFCNQRGGLIEPNSLNRNLKKCQERMREIAPEDMEIPEFTVHTLRHTFATRMLEQGVPQKMVAEWIGHSSTRITGDIYSHVIEEASKDWRAKIGNVIDFPKEEDEKNEF